ncbi:MAG: S8 family peptidase [bacterium]|nr:S8 family peptidase [bacterium]
MKKKFNALLATIVTIGVVLGLVGVVLVSQAKSESMARKIVVFKSGVLSEPAREALVKKFGGVKTKDLTLIDGKAVLLSPKAEAALARQAGVLRIDDDVVVEALVKEGSVKVKRASPQPVQIIPWGIKQIKADLVWPSYTADPIRVGIIDTGISNTHPDLLANVKGGVNTIYSWKNWNDDNGHGSHVAGIVGAIDNNIGVIGVGPKIDLYAIKVLDARGSGYLSDVIEGIQWAIDNQMQVINMSLGTTSNIQSFHDAVSAAKTAGIVVVAAAGNSGPGDNTVIYPAKYPETIAVSATDQNNVIASWSSRGPEVDLAAPGVSIYSTYKGTGYKTLSGTSMAAPHVAGSAALVLNTPVGAYDVNPTNGKWDPDEVQTKLQATATNLGDAILYGYGLVNAYAATR